MTIGQITVTSADDSFNVLDGVGNVVRLGIQGTSATFTINGGNAITLGQYGIYELDLSGGLGVITSLKFTEVNGTIYVDYVAMGGSAS